jgi:hypothetical protein
MLQFLHILHTLGSVQMTQVVEEQDRWAEHVATHVTPVTKSQLFERAIATGRGVCDLCGGERNRNCGCCGVLPG